MPGPSGSTSASMDRMNAAVLFQKQARKALSVMDYDFLIKKIFEYKASSDIEELLYSVGRIFSKSQHMKLLHGVASFITPEDRVTFQEECLVWQLTGEPLMPRLPSTCELANEAAIITLTELAQYSGILEKSVKVKRASEVGLEVSELLGRYFVIRVQNDSKAQKKGLREGDEILAVAGKRLQRLSVNEVNTLLVKHYAKLDLIVRPRKTPLIPDWHVCADDLLTPEQRKAISNAQSVMAQYKQQKAAAKAQAASLTSSTSGHRSPCRPIQVVAGSTRPPSSSLQQAPSATVPASLKQSSAKSSSVVPPSKGKSVSKTVSEAENIQPASNTTHQPKPVVEQLDVQKSLSSHPGMSEFAASTAPIKDGVLAPLNQKDISQNVELYTVNMLTKRSLKSLGFQIIGGADFRTDIFVSHVESGSIASHAGLKPGSRIMFVNGSNFDLLTHADAVRFLKAAQACNQWLHLSLEVNPTKFKLAQERMQALASASSSSKVYRTDIAKTPIKTPAKKTPAKKTPRKTPLKRLQQDHKTASPVHKVSSTPLSKTKDAFASRPRTPTSLSRTRHQPHPAAVPQQSQSPYVLHGVLSPVKVISDKVTSASSSAEAMTNATNSLPASRTVRTYAIGPGPSLFTHPPPQPTPLDCRNYKSTKRNTTGVASPRYVPLSAQRRTMSPFMRGAPLAKQCGWVSTFQAPSGNTPRSASKKSQGHNDSMVDDFNGSGKRSTPSSKSKKASQSQEQFGFDGFTPRTLGDYYSSDASPLCTRQGPVPIRSFDSESFPTTRTASSATTVSFPGQERSQSSKQQASKSQLSQSTRYPRSDNPLQIAPYTIQTAVKPPSVAAYRPQSSLSAPPAAPPPPPPPPLPSSLQTTVGSTPAELPVITPSVQRSYSSVGRIAPSRQGSFLDEIHSFARSKLRQTPSLKREEAGLRGILASKLATYRRSHIHDSEDSASDSDEWTSVTDSPQSTHI